METIMEVETEGERKSSPTEQRRLLSDKRGSFDNKRIVVGVCAMSKKCNARPMKEILNRLSKHPAIEIKIFTDEIILRRPVIEWPICDSLISFYSTGFPLNKAIEYVTLRKPFVINDLPIQYNIQDRRAVYEILRQAGVETARYAVLNEGDEPVVEGDDWIKVNGVKFKKPFVEKPVDAEDHNVYIYYPSSAGGGSQRLFRKVGDKSSEYCKEGAIRRTGSFIYEEFKATDGADVKVYTVGPHYAHAEARKCPALDGRVERDSQGKEIRFPVILTAKEKEMARKISLAFKQTVCGFDLLRANGQSYVCDVNGFSFVKTSKKYYDDCSQILLTIILNAVAPHLHTVGPTQDEPVIVKNNVPEDQVQLRCVVGIIRHGDRTPKQKMKMEVFHERFFNLVRKHGGEAKGHVKLKLPSHLQEVLDVARDLLDEVSSCQNAPLLQEEVHKLERLRSVLEMYGSFSGINRKVQFRYCRRKRKSQAAAAAFRKSATTLTTASRDSDVMLLLILKWGGELTATGRFQAEELGKTFRSMYPEESGELGSSFLRLHSSYRHDLKIYASDEGRVQMTAAAFAKGLLALEGGLTPILVSLVNTETTGNMLDYSTNVSPLMDSVKMKLHKAMEMDKHLDEGDVNELAPTSAESLLSSLRAIQNPFQACEMVYNLVYAVTEFLHGRIDDEGISSYQCLQYHGESLVLMAARWEKLAKDFKMKNGLFDISKIPDIYDCVKYDLLHNSHLHVKEWQELHGVVSKLADVVVPQEYGITDTEKVEISQAICSALLRKMRADFKHNVAQAENLNRLDPSYCDGTNFRFGHIRTRLYFTSESHVHSMVNILKHGGLFPSTLNEEWDGAIRYLEAIPELNYMTQFVFRLYEDMSKPLDSSERYSVEIKFSPGAQRWDEMAHASPAFKSTLGVSSPMVRRAKKYSRFDRPIDETDDDDECGSVVSSVVCGPFGSAENISPAERGLEADSSEKTQRGGGRIRGFERIPSPPAAMVTDKLSAERKLAYSRKLSSQRWVMKRPPYEWNAGRRKSSPSVFPGAGSATSPTFSTTSVVVSALNSLKVLHSAVPLVKMDGLLNQIALTEEQEVELQADLHSS